MSLDRSKLAMTCDLHDSNPVAQSTILVLLLLQQLKAATVLQAAALQTEIAKSSHAVCQPACLPAWRCNDYVNIFVLSL